MMTRPRETKTHESNNKKDNKPDNMLGRRTAGGGGGGRGACSVGARLGDVIVL